MVFLKPYAGFKEGDPCPKIHIYKKRRWLRLGVLGYAGDPSKTHNPKMTEPETSEDATPVAAEEGAKGWWTVLFSDGTEKKMRRDDVIAVGLLEQTDED